MKTIRSSGGSFSCLHRGPLSQKSSVALSLKSSVAVVALLGIVVTGRGCVRRGLNFIACFR